MRKLVSAASLVALSIVSACSSSSTSPGSDGSSADPARAARAPKADTELYGLGSIASEWPNGVVPVCFADTLNNAGLRGQIQTILGFSWSAAANITFTGFGACTGGNEVTVVFQNGTNGVTDNLGYGARTVTLIANDTRPNLTHFVYEVIHEFGHALGFAHEMKRPDNWNGNTILQCPVSGGNAPSQYALESGGIYLTPTYDVNSIMNYCDPQQNNTTSLSAGDIAGVSRPDAYGLPCLLPSPNAITLTQGDTTGVNVTMLTQNAWAGPQGPTGQVTPISVGVLSGLPSGVEAIPLNTYGTQVNFVAFSSAPVGTYVVTVKGNGADAAGSPESHQALLQVTVVAPLGGPAPPAPGCTWDYNCQSEPLPGGPIGSSEQVENVVTNCAISSTTTVQEVIGGSVTQLPPVVLGTNQTAYLIGTESDQFTVTAGPPLGTLAGIQACAHANGLTTCDPPTNLLISSCCTPKTCQAGACGVQSDGCGGTIDCGACCLSCGNRGAGGRCGTQSDGCGGTLQCSTDCGSAATCNANGVCQALSTCQPLTCADGLCGSQSDGCGGTLHCSTTCGAGNTCQDGVCQARKKCSTPRECCNQIDGCGWTTRGCICI